MKDSSKRKDVIMTVCCIFLLCACSGNDPADYAVPQDNAWDNIFVVTEQDRKVTEERVEDINLNESDGTVVISEGGDYFLHGSMEGRIIIDVYEDELVHLYLDDVDITSNEGPAIIGVSASKIVMTLVSDSNNTLSDTANYEGYEETESCLYSAPDLTINGDGALNVYGYYEDGIRSKDRIKILGGAIDVQAKGDGIRGNDGIMIQSGTLKVQSESNGIRTANQGADYKGVIEICGGTLDITSGRNGIYGVSDLYMKDCSCSIYSVEEKVRIDGTGYIEEGCLN